MDLANYGGAEILKNGYEILSYELSLVGQEMPVNKDVKGNRNLLLRELECAVIERIHQYNRELGKDGYDSVNPNCIKGYFKPLEPSKYWKIV